MHFVSSQNTQSTLIVACYPLHGISHCLEAEVVEIFPFIYFFCIIQRENLILIEKYCDEPGVVVHTFIPSTREAEADRVL